MDINYYYSKNRKREQQKYERKYTRKEYIDMIIDGINKCNFPSVVQYLLKETIKNYNYPKILYIKYYTSIGYYFYQNSNDSREKLSGEDINVDFNNIDKNTRIFYSLYSSWADDSHSLDKEHSVPIQDVENFKNHNFNEGFYQEGRKMRTEVHLLENKQIENILYAKYYNMGQWTKNIPTCVFIYLLFFKKISNYLNNDIIMLISDLLMLTFQ